MNIYTSMFCLNGCFCSDLHNCGLEGSLPKDFEFLTKLRDLILDQNHFTGSIPDNYCSLTNLVELFVPIVYFFHICLMV